MQGHEYLNRLTHDSIPTTLIPDARNVWILGDGVRSRQNVQYLQQDSIPLQFKVVEKKPKQ